MLVFSDAELGLLGKAFDRAWDKYLRAGVLTPDNLFESRQLLAGRILRSAYFGERDPFHLARDAVSYLWQVKNFAGAPAGSNRPGAARIRRNGALASPRLRQRGVTPACAGAVTPPSAPPG